MRPRRPPGRTARPSGRAAFHSERKTRADAAWRCAGDPRDEDYARWSTRVHPCPPSPGMFRSPSRGLRDAAERNARVDLHERVEIAVAVEVGGAGNVGVEVQGFAPGEHRAGRHVARRDRARRRLRSRRRRRWSASPRAGNSPKICITSTYMSALLTIRERVSPHVGCAPSCCPAAGAEGAETSAIVINDAGGRARFCGSERRATTPPSRPTTRSLASRGNHPPRGHPRAGALGSSRARPRRRQTTTRIPSARLSRRTRTMASRIGSLLLRDPTSSSAADAGEGPASTPTADATAATVRMGDLVIVYEGFNKQKAVTLTPKGQYQNRYGSFFHRDWVGKPYGCKVRQQRQRRLRVAPGPHPRALDQSAPPPHADPVPPRHLPGDARARAQARLGGDRVRHGLRLALALPRPRRRAPRSRLHLRVQPPPRGDRQRGRSWTTDSRSTAPSPTATSRRRDSRRRWKAVWTPPSSISRVRGSAFPSVARALRPDGIVCSFSPCIEQVQRTCEALEAHGFGDTQTVELLGREYDVESRELQRDLSCEQPKLQSRWKREAKEKAKRKRAGVKSEDADGDAGDAGDGDGAGGFVPRRRRWWRTRGNRRSRTRAISPSRGWCRTSPRRRRRRRERRGGRSGDARGTGGVPGKRTMSFQSRVDVGNTSEKFVFRTWAPRNLLLTFGCVRSD